MTIIAMAVAGGLAGLVGVGEVLGNAGQVPARILSRIRVHRDRRGAAGTEPTAGVVAAALLFGALQKGTADLDFETEHVTRELSLVLQALIILSVSADGLRSWMKKRSAA